jgi:hypothetical protein
MKQHQGGGAGTTRRPRLQQAVVHAADGHAPCTSRRRDLQRQAAIGSMGPTGAQTPLPNRRRGLRQAVVGGIGPMGVRVRGPRRRRPSAAAKSAGIQQNIMVGAHHSTCTAQDAACCAGMVPPSRTSCLQPGGAGLMDWGCVLLFGAGDCAHGLA